MNRAQMAQVIQMLAQGNGFYSRLFNAMCEDDDFAQEIYKTLEEAGVKDAVDIVMTLEA